MSYDVHVVCRPEVAPGFALAGLPTVDAGTPIDAADRLVELGNRADSGVILLQDNLYQGLPAEVRRKFGRRPLPMIVPFPGPDWGRRANEAEAYIVDLLRQVVGYRVKLR
ncbi:MAG: V-type ATP synthase subunit F [Gemmatimonadetes bacterium]|nr:V-type ATP synthase subunit F [Gemmatimonadota bacterium]